MESADITHTYTERFTEYKEDGTFENKAVEHTLKTHKTVPKLGIMLVGLGGNNGSTLAAGILAHKKNIKWESKKGMHEPNFYGSFSQCGTARTGVRRTGEGTIEDVYTPLKELLPTVNPVDFEITGWDISGMNLYDACKRAQVLEPDLVNKLEDDLKAIWPLKTAFNPEFVAAN